jgi:hypothetical protein
MSARGYSSFARFWLWHCAEMCVKTAALVLVVPSFQVRLFVVNGTTMMVRDARGRKLPECVLTGWC